ncbi:hypothetical protein DUNSADRAFT_827 [Dunaliella salina]|uniref:F-box domain-containing protein n=1 Tax=Dunaliella salina TaxID=3046 RepID=A0ABQ7GXU1_DUNSA|nr:hypothetical protein DUNSADRAFT_827 [Dunaliella salina]|eukprot:KAF5839425.1 hypothetical protein DUNSADRAFT_827 [Dunaliella salina]
MDPMRDMQEDLTDAEYLSIHEALEQMEAQGELSAPVADQAASAAAVPPASCSPHLLHLPDEILAIIYTKQDQDSRRSFAFTCRQLRYLPGIAPHTLSPVRTITFQSLWGVPTPSPAPTTPPPKGINTLKLLGHPEDLGFSFEDYERDPADPAPLRVFLDSMRRNARFLHPRSPSAVTTLVLQEWDLTARSEGPSIMGALSALFPAAALVLKQCQYSPLVIASNPLMPCPLSRLTNLTITDDSRVDSLWDEWGVERVGYGLNAVLRSLSRLTALQSLGWTLATLIGIAAFTRQCVGMTITQIPSCNLPH